jgi:hypothetical protein
LEQIGLKIIQKVVVLNNRKVLFKAAFQEKLQLHPTGNQARSTVKKQTIYIMFICK